jgi:hypothetical protein
MTRFTEEHGLAGLTRIPRRSARHDRRGVGLARAARAVVGVLRGECQALRARRAIQPCRGEAEGQDPRGQGDVRTYVQRARLKEAALQRIPWERHDRRARARGPKRATADNPPGIIGRSDLPTLRERSAQSRNPARGMR